jgi:hypothetical protein
MRNPVRRSRNIGTAKQGHGQSNRLVIPRAGDEIRLWTETLGAHQVIHRTIASMRSVVFLAEPNTAGCIHACTVDDVARVLTHIPLDDWRGMETFVLRQTTRKQRLLNPVWGRMFYSADLGRRGRKNGRLGPAVMLDAVDCSKPVSWSVSLDPDDQAELERLRQDGHQIERSGHRHVITVTPRSARATQLYRTLLHEIGHWVDYVQKVEAPAGEDNDLYFDLSEAYFARSKDEREKFAHDYADRMRARLTETGAIPFEQASETSSEPL